eukprot:Lithocolla_globosa_v1_NODE_4401_length_1445_cov_4.872662.p2 type:complete len:109 gc:universal NODE_4401_length_1445_cov_4.872662:484-810(+)
MWFRFFFSLSQHRINAFPVVKTQIQHGRIQLWLMIACVIQVTKEMDLIVLYAALDPIVLTQVIVVFFAIRMLTRAPSPVTKHRIVTAKLVLKEMVHTVNIVGLGIIKS